LRRMKPDFKGAPEPPTTDQGRGTPARIKKKAIKTRKTMGIKGEKINWSSCTKKRKKQKVQEGRSSSYDPTQKEERADEHAGN